MEENKHQWDVVMKGTKHVFYCLIGDCAGTFTRSKLCGLNHHRTVIHNLPPIPQRPRGRQRNENAKRTSKSPSKIQRQNQKFQCNVDARLCRARKQAYTRFVIEEILSAVSIYWHYCVCVCLDNMNLLLNLLIFLSAVSCYS